MAGPQISNLVPIVTNMEGTLLASSLVSASFDTDDQFNAAACGLVVVIKITAVDSGSIVATIQGKDPATGTYYTILASASLNSGTTVLRVHPLLTASSNTIAKDVIPRTWRVDVVLTGTSVTFSMGSSLTN
jgi:hypothetical protein